MHIKNTTTKRNRLTFGFTLIEIVVAISIIGILAGISIVSYGNWQRSVTTATLKSDLNGASSAMENARTFGTNGYPADITAVSTFTPSATVSLSGGSTDGGKTYCISATSSEDTTIQYYISSITGAQSPQQGSCVTSAPTIAVGTITSSSIALSWNTITSATSYTLQRDVSSSFTSADLAIFTQSSPHTSSGLLPGTTYYYRVRANNAGSTSPWSATASAATTITAPSAPTITVILSSPNVLATITPVTCTGTTTQYQINSRTNDGSWAGWTAWSTTTTASRTANDGVKYGYQAQARCYVDASHYSTTATGTESTYIDPITTPTAPVVSANTVGATTTWSWPNTCPSGTTARYQWRYTITPGSPTPFDSGWYTPTNPAALSTTPDFTTSTEGQTYTVNVQAQCYNAATTSAWSVAGSASWYHPITTYVLTTVAGTGGTVNTGGTYNTGTVQTITATPSTYYSFTSWTGSTGCSGVASHTITMDANKSCTANFTPTAIGTPTMTAVTTPTTGDTTTWSWSAVSCPGNTARYQYDYLIDSVSQAPAGWKTPTVPTATSINFTTVTEGHTYAVLVQAQCYNAVTSSAWSASSNTASWYHPITTYVLTTVAGAGGTVSAGGTYNTGTVQTITATPNANYSFSSWSGSTGCSGVASHTITMDANKTCTANFTIITYTLTITAGANGTVNTGGTYNSGTVQTITANPSAYYLFSSWSGSTGCSGVASHTITMDANKSCTANFTLNPNWIAGIAATALAGKFVESAPVGGTWYYKSVASAVASPQGATGLDPNYPSNMSLVDPQTNPGVDFFSPTSGYYSAQQACKDHGGRLPDMQELGAIYAGLATYGSGNPINQQHWSSTEGASNSAYVVSFSTGSTSNILKTSSVSVRCVAG